MDLHLTCTMLYLNKLNLNTGPANLSSVTHTTLSNWLLRNVPRLRRFRKISRPLWDVTIGGLICGGSLVVHSWPVCVSVQSADMGRQMLFLHSRNTICEQRLKHSTDSLRLNVSSFAKTHKRHKNLETVKAFLGCV